MKFTKLLATFALTALVTTAQADLISIVGGVELTAPGNNNFVAGSTYNVGGNVYADFDVLLTFTYLGHEAGYNNDFNALGNTLNNKGNTIGDSFSVDASSGLIDFDFFSNSVGAGVDNGSNFVFGSFQSFATVLDYTWSNGTVFDAVLFFDDSGASIDDDHDDHIIGVTALRTSVVEASAPGTLAFLGLGLVGMSLAKRRKA